MTITTNINFINILYFIIFVLFCLLILTVILHKKKYNVKIFIGIITIILITIIVIIGLFLSKLSGIW